MKTRLITAGIAIMIAVLIFFFGEMNSIVIAIAVSAVSAIMCGEYLSARNLHKDMRIFIPCLAFSFLIPLLSYSVLGFIPLFLFVLYLSALTVFAYKSIPIEDILFTGFGMVVLSGSMALFNIRVCAENRYTTFWAVLILGIPWIADSAAYFVGSAMGKRKLCPVISPKKTVEGAVGGLIAATLSPFLFAFVFTLIYGNVTICWWILPILGAVNAVISILGDLLFSVIKRGCGIKDYGSIMPGHGGLLDRFDSVILCVPVVYFVSQYITIIA
jgi:phosphatidate cytidylyltransferase